MAKQVVLEVTERTKLDQVPDVRGRISRLRQLGYRIAIDDLGAGYSALSSFAQLEPEFVKLDISLVRDVDTVPVKHKLVRALVSLAKEMNVVVVAEGVETAVQGFLFALPGKPFPEVTW
jgi:EAL domain-containing protein (putative c-di-GMP-specific phosphodiesterase class I)